MALTSVDFDKLIVDTMDLVTAYNISDGSLYFMLDQLKDGSIENGSETVYGTGKAGVRLSALNRNKSAKATVNNGYVVASAFAAQVGATIEDASAENKIAVPDVAFITLTDATKATLPYAASGTVGAEFPYIYKAREDKTQGEKYAIAAAASATEFKYTAGTKEITLPTGVFQVGDVVIVPYNREVTVGKKITNKADQFSKTARVVIDCTCRDICDMSKVYHGVFVFPKANLDGNFSMAFGSEPMAHSIAIEALQDVCSVNKELYSFYIA